MAVTRQRTQIFNQPVGVVRAAAGAASVGESISRAAGTIANLAYRDAAISAEETGRKAAQSQPSDRISTIDPNTNMPVAYTPPSSFGTIAARSYQNMIDRRFEESILKEFETKGAEFAASSRSANQYKENISNYIEEMYNAQGEATPYSRYIEEAGKEYVASTFATLAKREADAAREALINQQLMDGYRDKQKLAALVASGASNEEIAALSASLRARNLDLLNVKGVTFKQWIAENEAIDGIQALHANNDLVKFYSQLSPSDQSVMKLAVTDPSALDKLSDPLNPSQRENLQALIVKAKTATSTTSLLAAFDSYAGITEDYVESQVNNLISQYAPSISASTTINEIGNIVFDIADSEIRLEVGGELITEWVIKNLDAAGKSAADLDVISEALLDEASPNYDAISKLIGGNQGKQVANEIQSMTQEQRSALSKDLVDRRAALERIEDANLNEVENNIRKEISDIRTTDDFVNLYNTLSSSITFTRLDESTKATLRSVLDENYSERARIDSDKIPLSTVELQELNNAITDVSPNLTGNALEAWNLLRPAYEKTPSRISSYLDRRLKSSENKNTQVINSTRLSAIEANLSSVSKDELAFYEKETLGDIIITAENMLSYAVITDALNEGVVLPKVKTALESALFSNNEENLNSGLQTFERFSNVQTVTSDGRRGSLDIMRKSLSPETYALYSAISQTARAEGVEPLAIAVEFRNFDGNIDDAIKEDLAIAKSGSINRALDGYPMSQNYKKEILAMLRMQKVRGRTITEDGVSSIIDNYTSKMASDPAVFGPYIGDKTEFARNIFFSDVEIIADRNKLTDLLADSGMFDDLLKGGTLLDSAASSFANYIGGDLLLTSRAIVEQFTTGVGASEKLTDRDRLRQGLAALNIDLAYQPDVASIYAGEPRFFVGYINEYGGFENIIINDKPYVLEKQTTLSENQAQLRLQTLNNFTVAVKANAPKDMQAIAEINYLATLDHMSFDKFIGDEARLRTYEKIFNDDERAIEIYRTKRGEYDDLSKDKPLRITITEGNSLE